MKSRKNKSTKVGESVLYQVKVIVGGKEAVYPSIASASKATGVYRMTIRKHMLNGTFSKSSMGRIPKKAVTARNDRAGIRESYPSIVEAARCLGVSVDTIRRRLSDGGWVRSEGICVKVACL